MTFNVGLDLAPPTQIGTVIANEQADLVALQEVTEPMGNLLPLHGG
jgi:endonuclease/exonuclease/phosphatase family metal-dependent hydrolase